MTDGRCSFQYSIFQTSSFAPPVRKYKNRFYNNIKLITVLIFSYLVVFLSLVGKAGCPGRSCSLPSGLARGTQGSGYIYRSAVDASWVLSYANTMYVRTAINIYSAAVLVPPVCCARELSPLSLFPLSLSGCRAMHHSNPHDVHSGLLPSWTRSASFSRLFLLCTAHAVYVATTTCCLTWSTVGAAEYIGSS